MMTDSKQKFKAINDREEELLIKRKKEIEVN